MPHLPQTYGGETLHHITVNDPVKDILDRIRNGHITPLIAGVHGGHKARIPVVEYFGSKTVTCLDGIEMVDG